MSTDVLERVRSEIEDRLAVLSGAVSEAQQLEIALVALEEVPVASRPAGDAGHGRRRRKAAREVHARKGRRRRVTTAGANDQTVLDSLQGLTEPLDIKAVMGRTGLSQQTASYTLKKLAGKGLLTQSSVAGGRGRPKLVFALASSPETTAPVAPKRKARKKARRRSKAPVSAMAN
jgi:DNA-binding transcriptional ArsR family regulator